MTVYLWKYWREMEVNRKIKIKKKSQAKIKPSPLLKQAFLLNLKQQRKTRKIQYLTLGEQH